MTILTQYRSHPSPSRQRRKRVAAGWTVLKIPGFNIDSSTLKATVTTWKIIRNDWHIKALPVDFGWRRRVFSGSESHHSTSNTNFPSTALSDKGFRLKMDYCGCWMHISLWVWGVSSFRFIPKILASNLLLCPLIHEVHMYGKVSGVNHLWC